MKLISTNLELKPELNFILRLYINKPTNPNNIISTKLKRIVFMSVIRPLINSNKTYINHINGKILIVNSFWFFMGIHLLKYCLYKSVTYGKKKIIIM